MAKSEVRGQRSEVREPRPEREDGVAEIVVRLPMLETARRRPQDYVSRQIAGALTQEQGEALKSLFDGLRARHAQLAGGRHVDCALDAVRWVLEQAGRDQDGSGQ